MGQPLEEAEFRRAVALEGAVQVEVLVAQVRQDGDVVRDRRHPVQRQPVRRGLQDRDRVAGLDHRPERRLELRRLRRRDVLGVGFARPVDLRFDRSDQARGQPGCLEDGSGQGAGGALAVRARHADHRQVVARVAEPPGGGVGQCRTARVDHELGQRDLRQGPLHDRGRGSRLRCPEDEVVAVGAVPGDGHEQRPWANLS